MSYDPPPPAGHRRVFLELYVRDDERGSKRRIDVPIDVPVPPGGSLGEVPTAELLAVLRRALGA